MVRCLLIFTLLLSTLSGFSQSLDLKDLLSFTDQPSSKTESILVRKRFRPSGFAEDGAKVFLHQKGKGDSISTCIMELKNQSSQISLTLKTSDSSTFFNLVKALRTGGFLYPAGVAELTPALYQKAGYSVQTKLAVQDTVTLYQVSFAKQTIPQSREIMHAEDLTRVSSEAIARALFEPGAVMSDHFYFSSTDSVACTVIYPNSARQAVIVWKDGINKKDIAFVGVGIEPHINEQRQPPKFLSNSWITRQGIFCGMDLRQLIRINERPLKFYNWQTEAAGMLLPDKEDKLNLENMTIELGCFNCDVEHEKQEIVSSGEALEKYQRVYVRSFVIVPTK